MDARRVIPIDRDQEGERAARIDALLEETRSKTEALGEDVKRAKQQLRNVERRVKAGLEAARSHRTRKKSA